MARELEEIHLEVHRLHHDPSPMTGERWYLLKEAVQRREKLAPQVGDPAPDFELPLLRGGGQRVRLSALRGLPVALIFGSYT